MIRSRRWSVGCGALAGLLTTPFALSLAGLVAMGGAHNPDAPWWRPFVAFLLPGVVTIGSVALLSWGRRSLMAIGAGLAGTALGIALVAGWLWGDETFFRQKIEYVNNTNLFIVTYSEREGLGLHREYPLRPGESYKDPIGLRKNGTGIRIIALDVTRHMDSEEYNNTLPWDISKAEEQRLPFRKIFDETYTWDMLSKVGGRVIFTAAEVLP